MPAAGASAIVASTDEEAESKTCKEIAKPGTDFVWTQLRSLGSFLGVRESLIQKQQQLESMSQQEATPEQAQSESQRTAAAEGDATQSAAAEPMDTNTAGHQSNQHPSLSPQVKAPGAVNGATADTSCSRQPSSDTAANGSMQHTPNGLGEPTNQAPVKKEEAVSTTEEHTESHKYVKTERDSAGRQQSAAELVQKKTTTQVHKRKREETSSGGGANSEVDGSQPNPSETRASPPRVSGASEQERTADHQSSGGPGCTPQDYPAGRPALQILLITLITQVVPLVAISFNCFNLCTKRPKSISRLICR